MIQTERKASDRAVLLALALPDVSRRVAAEHLDELEGLVAAAGGATVARFIQDRQRPDAAFYIGKGKVREVADAVKDFNATVVIVDDDLAPAQARNLEKEIGARVIDRSGLILDIFARRARSREARTQVELAQLEYYLPRLTRAWTHLERQAGGIGTRGVGETQLELDRRIVRTRIARLKEELEKIERTRQTQRMGRERVRVVALVGYTNAGKSTLFNALTDGSVEVANKLFATLDPKTQKSRYQLPEPTVFVDTVGFIRKLPHNLVASFRSTMEEAVDADLVLHVINAAHPQADEQREVGHEVLEGLGVDRRRVLDVWNKVDLLGGELPVGAEPGALGVSAVTGEGIEELMRALARRQHEEGEELTLLIPHDQSRVMAQLHEVAVIRDSAVEDDGLRVTAWIPRDSLHQFEPWRTLESARAFSG